MTKALSYDDILLIPQYSTLLSRSEADTSVEVGEYKRSNPIISANMKSVSDSYMCLSMWNCGGIGALHRFMSIEDNVIEYQRVVESGADCFVSVGVKEEDKQRAKSLYDVGAQMFIVDIAHVHSLVGRKMIEWLKDKFAENILLVAGNTATPEAVYDIVKWGADICKIGIGQGSICTTRTTTGHGYPSFSSVLECSKEAKLYNKKTICDGGIKTSGDLCKGLAAGAHYVMLGSLLAKAEESASLIVKGVKDYYGSAAYPNNPTIAPEGVHAKIKVAGKLKDIMNDLVGGLKSGMSYSNARSIDEFHKNVKWIEQTNGAYREGTPHIFDIAIKEG